MHMAPITKAPVIAAPGLSNGGTSSPLRIANKGQMQSKKKLEMAKILCMTE